MDSLRTVSDEKSTKSDSDHRKLIQNYDVQTR